jgi:hypothetical protein
MYFEARTFWLPKDSEDPDRYQDAFGFDAQRGVAAIADGVSSAIFSGPWARQLTEAIVSQLPPLDDSAAFQSWLAELRSVWRSQIDVSRLTFYQRPKMADGAMTTALWVKLEPGEEAPAGPAPAKLRLQCIAIGDSCLFHLREGNLLRLFPLQNSADFALSPNVIGSVNLKRDHLLEFQAINEECLAGDLLVLCTDAVALWAATRWEAGDPVPWDDYWDLSPEAWSAEIESLRQQNLMRIDDVTLLLLRVLAPCAPGSEHAGGTGEPQQNEEPLQTPEPAVPTAENADLPSPEPEYATDAAAERESVTPET